MLSTVESFYYHFVRQVQTYADHTALIIEQGLHLKRISYGALYQQVNLLATKLQETYPPGTHVGVFLPRGAEWITAILALWQAKMTYVPIGTDSHSVPNTRVQTILEHCHIGTIITNQTLLETRLSQLTQLPCEILDSLDFNHPNTLFPELSPTLVDENAPAYILYTSGSTGTPKGVAISHRGLPNCYRSMNRMLEVTSQDVIAQFAGTTFDASICEIIMALGAGAALFIAPETKRLQFSELAASYSRAQVSVAIFTPSLLRYTKPEQFIAHSHSGSSSSSSSANNTAASAILRIVSTGEALTPDVLMRWGNSAACRLFNGYGPTEATIATSMGPVHPEQDIHIGHMSEDGLIDGLKVWILKTNPETGAWEQVAPGEKGEICISGSGLALGYYGEDAAIKALNEQFFLTIPHPNESSQFLRIYRTLDEGCINEQNQLIITGRLGRRCKIAGKLVIFDDVEAEIRCQLGDTLTEIWVDFTEDESSLKTLTAYIRLNQATLASAENPLISAQDWQDFIAQLTTKLPYYATPSRWFVLTEPFPRHAASQKTDGAALRVLCKGGTPQVISPPGIRALDEIENALANQWQVQLQGTFALTTTQNFLHIGGDSFGIIQLAQHYSAKYQLSAEASHHLLHRFISYPTLAQMAQNLKRIRGEMPYGKAILLSGSDKATRPPLFMIHALMGNARVDYRVLTEIWSRVSGRKQALYGINAHSCQEGLPQTSMPSDLNAIADDYCQAIIQAHESETWHHKTEADPYFIAGWSAGGVIALAVAAKLKQRGKKVVVQMIDSSSPILLQEMSADTFYPYLTHLFQHHIAKRYGIDVDVMASQLKRRWRLLPKTTQIERLFNLAMHLLPDTLTKVQSIRELEAAEGLMIATLQDEQVPIDQSVTLYVIPATQITCAKPELGWSLPALQTVTLPDSEDHMSIFMRESACYLIAKALITKCHYAHDPLEQALTHMHQDLFLRAHLFPELRFYTPIKAVVPQHVLTPEDVATKVTHFLQSETKQVMLLQGDSGSGKSMFCLHWMGNYAGTYQPGTKPLLFISLPQIVDITNDVVTQHLKQLGFTDVDILALKARELIFLLDSYDEVASFQAGIWHNVVDDIRKQGWQGKIIITCRSSFLERRLDYKQLFAPYDDERRRVDIFEENKIVPFDQHDIEQYLEIRLAHDDTFRQEMAQRPDHSHWLDKQTYLNHFKLISGLDTLITNPYLLKIAFEILPITAERYRHLTEHRDVQKLLMLDLFYDFTEFWFMRQADKLMASGQHSGEELTRDYRDYAQAVAIEMYTRGQTQLSYRPPSKYSRSTSCNTSEPNPLDTLFGNTNAEITQERKACPLNIETYRGQVLFKFLHPALMEYFVYEFYQQAENQAAEPYTPSYFPFENRQTLTSLTSFTSTSSSSSSSSASSTSTFYTHSGPSGSTLFPPLSSASRPQTSLSIIATSAPATVALNNFKSL